MATERFGNGGEPREREGRPPDRGGAGAAPAGRRAARPAGWVRWVPAAAPVWSLLYAALAAYWALSGRGFPYAGEISAAVGPLAARFGAGPAWVPVVLVGLPAAAAGAAMLGGMRRGRRGLIAAGALFSVLLLFTMIDVGLLTLVGYLPYGIVGIATGSEAGAVVLQQARSWEIAHQVICLAGGFCWAAATLAYARGSRGDCLRCGRGGGAAAGWTSPRSAARWGAVAVYAAMVPPLLYAATRYAWALGIPLGISDEFLREGQQSGAWIAGAFLAGFATVGAVLTLGLAQRWGEVFPRWMAGLAGRRVPIGLAVVPASTAAVLTMVGGIAMVSGYAEQVGTAATGGDTAATGVLVGVSGALFPLWGAALGVAALGYYLRRRGACADCGRGGEAG
ncbi:hypothetical protein GCM10027570_42860 [Streptomonospora sediminis]